MTVEPSVVRSVYTSGDSDIFYQSARQRVDYGAPAVTKRCVGHVDH